MKRIPCDLFGEGQKIYFNMLRLAELERALARPIQTAFVNGLGIGDLLSAFSIGLQHEKRRSEQWYGDKMQELMDEGQYELTDFMIPVQKALIGSGILGKKVYYNTFPEEMTEEDKAEIEAESTAKN